MLDKHGGEENLDPTKGAPLTVKAAPDLYQAIKASKVIFNPIEDPGISV
jgi:hypothetical protein